MTASEAFSLLNEGTGPDRTIDTAAILARTDISDDQKRCDLWVRICARLAASDMVKKRYKGKGADWRFTAYGEQQMELWELYFADELHKGDPEYTAVKESGQVWLLF